MGAQMATRQSEILKDALGWGFILWLIGYVIGIILFFIVPISLIGWLLMPIGIAITLWVLVKRINATDLRHYVVVAIAWTAIAVVLDYLLIVKVFDPPDGYYKLDVYLYYAVTLLLPLIVGWRRQAKSNQPMAR